MQEHKVIGMRKNETFVERLSDILVKRGTITQQEAHDFKNLFKERSKAAFDNFLLEEGFVQKEHLLEALSEYYQVPSFDPVGYFFDHYLVTRLPKGVMQRNIFIPLEVDENMLVVIASNPEDAFLLEVIGEYLSYDVQFMVGIEQDILDSIEEFYDSAPTVYPSDEAQLFEEHEEEADLQNIENGYEDE